ncbi:peptidase inhibitor family I36 protein [Streptomyces sp. NPDC017941]|uniref:peptidase inhibitor family I36 protein n=1 Tax=unclassified Streptomyces TaxID=2593676 RepID=UPI0037B7D2E4
MTSTRNSRIAAMAAGGVLALTAALGSGAGAASAGERAWAGCERGEICVYSGPGGTGTRCDWYPDDPDWLTGAETCTIRVRSIWNNGEAGGFDDVKFYFDTDYRNYYACARNQWRGETGPDAGVKLRSHRWSKTC